MSQFCPKCGEAFEDPSLETCPHDDRLLREVEGEATRAGHLIEGRYRLVEKIGSGTVGVVYRAVQCSIERHVAIKLLRGGFTPDERELERFRREARMVSKLSHPNIVQPIDHGRDRREGVVYLAMDLLPGIDLGSVLEGGPVPVNVALEIAYQVCGALAETHAAEIVHRDLKPGNIMLTPVPDGTVLVRILDFGFARALDERHRLTADGRVGGTPLFMSPEQALDEPIDPRSDLYSLGVVLHEAITGEPLFEGSVADVMEGHVEGEAPSLRDHVPSERSIPDEVEALVSSLLCTSLEDRPDDARDVRARIRSIQDSVDLDAIATTPKQSAARILERFLQRAPLDQSFRESILSFESTTLARISPPDIGGILE